MQAWRTKEVYVNFGKPVKQEGKREEIKTKVVHNNNPKKLESVFILM